MKKVKVFTGTAIPICSPSHPYAVAFQVNRIIDRIVDSTDNEFQYNCNSEEGIEVFEEYGRKIKGLHIQYYINSKPATHQEVIDDLGRGRKYVTEMLLQYANKDDETD